MHPEGGGGCFRTKQTDAPLQRRNIPQRYDCISGREYGLQLSTRQHNQNCLPYMRVVAPSTRAFIRSVASRLSLIFCGFYSGFRHWDHSRGGPWLFQFHFKHSIDGIDRGPGNRNHQIMLRLLEQKRWPVKQRHFYHTHGQSRQ